MVRAKRRPFKSSSVLLQIPRQGHDGGEHRQRGGLAAEDTGAKAHRFCPGLSGHFGLLGGKAALGAGHDGKAQLLPVGGLCFRQQLTQGCAAALVAEQHKIVLCKGVNDGDELEYSLEKLSAYAPVLQSVSVVPVGLTKYRKGLYPLEPFNKEDAEKVLNQIERWQKIMKEKYGIHFIHASDEWYILSDRELPCEEEYDGYLQLENGVGMLRLLETEVKETLKKLTGDDRKVTGRIATGKLAAPFIARYIEEIKKKFPNVQIPVTTIENRFFGEKITVSGLITGQDLKEQLSGLDLGEKLLIPCSMLKGDEEIFLDDMTLKELSEALKTEIVIVDTGGRDLVEAVINPPKHKPTRRRQIYEQTSSSDSGKA